jgi:dTDP-4-dehydrorhamnose 3,5-epimerase
MRVVQTDLPGVLIVEPDVHRDARGFFLETYHAAKFASAGLDVSFVQDNHSSSVQHTLRGLHAQRTRPQGKLVRAVEGEIWDVAVDLRPDAPTFGQWTATTLSADNFRQLYIPPGFAHGFCVLSLTAQVEYKCTTFYDPSDEIGIAYNDPDVAIRWPVAHPVLSERDKGHPRLAELRERLVPSVVR